MDSTFFRGAVGCGMWGNVMSVVSVENECGDVMNVENAYK